jgi:hypothetical protein
MKLQRALIEVLDEEAYKHGGLLKPFFYVQFNPTEYTLQKGAQIAEIGIYGIDSPILQFIRGQNEKLTLDLFFDTTDGGMAEGAKDVRKETNLLLFYQLVKIQPKTHAPPRISFTWGKGLSFKAIVESVQQKFDLFSPEGIPLRATLSVSFREYKTLEEQLSELKLESPDHSKTYVVERGDSLARIAATAYGDPALWREIAAANPNLPNPRNLQPGTELYIPPLEAFKQSVVNRS